VSIHNVVAKMEKSNPLVVGTNDWNELKFLIEEAFPKLTPIFIGSVYKMVAKGLTRRVIVTKENQKTWVMYEVEDSARPGCRWMIGKTWCTKDNIWRDEAQSYSLPAGVKLK